ncbi:MAG: ECF-type sigma factor [Gemmatimonadota bacterium]
MESSEAITRLLREAGAGDEEAAHRLLPLVYDELREIAHRHLRKERVGHTLNTTALVHEAWIRVAGQDRTVWQNRLHFYAVASTAMRRVLLNYAEKRRAQKRGGNAPHVPLEEVEEILGEREAEEIEALDEALNRLKAFNPRGEAVVVYRFFGGLTHDEIADLLGTSTVTVRRSWSSARSWLRREVRVTLGFEPELGVPQAEGGGR